MRSQYWYLGAVFAFAALFAAPPQASAEMVQGQVAAVNQQNQTITVRQQGGLGEQGKLVTYDINTDTSFQGIQSLSDLNVGDEIRVETESSFFGKDAARNIEAFQTAGGFSGQGQQSQAAGQEGFSANPAGTPGQQSGQQGQALRSQEGRLSGPQGQGETTGSRQSQLSGVQESEAGRSSLERQSSFETRADVPGQATRSGSSLQSQTQGSFEQQSAQSPVGQSGQPGESRQGRSPGAERSGMNVTGGSAQGGAGR